MFLDKNEWGEKYNQLTNEFKNDFFKFETLEQYNDYGITDWTNIPNLEMLDLIKKSQAAILLMTSQLQSSLVRGCKIKRVRYLTFPLSKYILRQFSVFRIYQNLGIDIEIFEDIGQVKDIDKSLFRDFLLFDESKLLLIDNPNGVYNGGLFTEKIDEIKPYIDLKKIICKNTIKFDDYINNFNIQINNIAEK
jgi:hypothetical protein